MDDFPEPKAWMVLGVPFAPAQYAVLGKILDEGVAQERERCAKLADEYAADDWIGAEGARRVATAIRKDTE